MDVFSKRCGCGAIFKLASLRARTTQCEQCARKGALVGPVSRQVTVHHTGPVTLQTKPRDVVVTAPLTSGALLPPGHNPYRDAKAAWGARFEPFVWQPPADTARIWNQQLSRILAARAFCAFAAQWGQQHNRVRAPRHLRAQLKQIKGEWYRDFDTEAHP